MEATPNTTTLVETPQAAASSRPLNRAAKPAPAADPQVALQTAFAGKKGAKKRATSVVAAPAATAFFTLPENLIVAPQASDFRHTATTPACSIVHATPKASGTANSKRVGLPSANRPRSTGNSFRKTLSFPQARRDNGQIDLSEVGDTDLHQIVDAWPSLPRTVRSAILAIICSVHTVKPV